MKSNMTASGAQVRLYSRPGNDLTHRFPLIVETLARLRSRSCIIDGETVACDDNGVAYAFDLIELNGDDLRRDPLEVRKATLASIVAKASKLTSLTAAINIVPWAPAPARTGRTLCSPRPN